MRSKARILALVLALGVVIALLSSCSLGHLAPLRAAQDLAAQLAPEEAPAALPQATPAPAHAPISSASAGALAALEGTLQSIYEQVGPSVVSIQVSQKQTSTGNWPFSWPFGEWPFDGFGWQEEPLEQYRQSSGSGFVWDKQGHIVTNNHVVAGADTIKVIFADDTVVSGEVVGTDPDSDLAVVKVDLPADRLQPVQLADSTQVRVGSLAIAIGQPFGLENTMTVGFVSALGRSLPVESEASASADAPSYTIPDVIQTDAPINPGNSGGVLLNSEGQVIGVTTAIVSPARASAGVGFAVPSAIVQQVVPVLIEEGRYAYPWLGISGTTLNSELAVAMGLDQDQRGALVVEVTPGAAGDKAGLRGSDRTINIDGRDARIGGDVITAINGAPVRTFDDLVSYLVRSTQAGEKVTLTILRGGKEQQVEVTLAARGDRAAQPQRVSREEQAGPLWLGVNGVSLVPQIAEAAGLPGEQEGVLVQEIVGGSPADKAGLRGSYKPVTVGGRRVLVGGDVITGWNGEPVTRIQDLQSFLSRASVGDEVTLIVLRDGREMEVKMTLEAQPASH